MRKGPLNDHFPNTFLLFGKINFDIWKNTFWYLDKIHIGREHLKTSLKAASGVGRCDAVLCDAPSTVEWTLPKSCKNKLFGRRLSVIAKRKHASQKKGTAAAEKNKQVLKARKNKNTFIADRPSFKGCWPTQIECMNMFWHAQTCRIADMQTFTGQTRKYAI